MRTKLHKWFWVWDYQKEEQWLNDMAARGMALTSVGFGTYVFEDAAPEAYQFRLELLKNHPGHAESVKYLRFLEETGIEHIGSVMNWVYLRRKADGSEFELYSDHESRVQLFQRIKRLLIVPLPFLVFAGIYNLSLFAVHGLFISLFAGLLTIPVIVLLLCGLRKVIALQADMAQQHQLYE